ncbi:MAG TPA: hypothetical protein PLH57_08685 [Oligoflexia bacterium]|nr:hypothetical protein [Oligoflexia bacterium]
MLTATKENRDGKQFVLLGGTIDETDDLAKVIGMPTGPLIVSCRDLTRINSVGVKNWMKYFSQLQQNKLQFEFEELSVALVEQVNIVKNFACGGPVLSIAMPFRCNSCQTGLTGAIKTEVVRSMNFNIAPVQCPKCGGSAEFDDVAEEYFSFLTRS